MPDKGKANTFTDALHRAKTKVISSAAIARQRFNSFHPDDYDDNGEPYLTKDMNARQVAEGLARRKADLARRQP